MSNILAYSLPQKAWIPLANASAIVCDTSLSAEAYYDACRMIFPLVTDMMTIEEMHATRNLSGWAPDQETTGLRVDNTQTLVAETNRLYGINAEQVSFAHLLPNHLADVPLLGRWKQVGQNLYQTIRFAFYRADTLKRDAGAYADIIGNAWHGDYPYKNGHSVRAMSALSICADSSLECSPCIAPEKEGPWWATRWLDHTSISYDIFELMHDNIKRVVIQDWISENYPHAALPVGAHIILPTWMTHRASNITFAPESYKVSYPEGKEQPKAYINHAILLCPFL